MGEKGPGHDAQLRERGGVWYGALERGGRSAGRQDARPAGAGDSRHGT
jgi:hypothetical protein